MHSVVFPNFVFGAYVNTYKCIYTRMYSLMNTYKCNCTIKSILIHMNVYVMNEDEKC